MKKVLGVLVAVALVGSALAQGTFTIRQPVDGATVRETVRILVPRNSIPEGGYLGVVVNGRFLEAVIPPVEGENYVYRLDTRARGLDDGETTIELILYVDFAQQARIVDRSRITVNIDNRSSIQVPDQGFALRYRWQPGQTWVYETNLRQTVSTISQAERARGSRPAALDIEGERFRMSYAVLNAFNVAGDRQALVRVMPLPPRGQHFAELTASGSNSAQIYYDYQMAPIYMRLTGTGREIFSSLPINLVPIEGTSGGGRNLLNLYAFFFLPVLPERTVRVGDVWQAPILSTDGSIEELFDRDRFTVGQPSRATLEGIEFQNGRPAAVIRQVLTEGTDRLTLLSISGQDLGDVEDVTIEAEELIFFDIQRGVVTRLESRFTQEVVIDVPVGGFGGGGAFGGPGGNLPPTGAAGMGGGGASSGGPGEAAFIFAPYRDARGNLGLFQTRGGPGGPGGPPGLPPTGAAGAGGFGGPGGGFGQGGGGQTQRRIMRMQATIIKTLEE